MSETRIEVLAPGRYRVDGALTLETVTALRDYAFEAAAGASEVDLAGVAGADSAALALLLHWQRNAMARGEALTYSNLPERLGALIDLYDLDGILPIVTA